MSAVGTLRVPLGGTTHSSVNAVRAPREAGMGPSSWLLLSSLRRTAQLVRVNKRENKAHRCCKAVKRPI